VGFALYGLPFFYDFMVKEYGWTRAQVTSGNAYSKLVIGPLFGFFAGWFVDRFGSRRLMIIGILLAGLAPIGLGAMTSLAMFYTFYLCNALGYVLGGPLPNQVLLSRWFDAGCVAMARPPASASAARCTLSRTLERKPLAAARCAARRPRWIACRAASDRRRGCRPRARLRARW
jgi:MFS family permease